MTTHPAEPGGNALSRIAWRAALGLPQQRSGTQNALLERLVVMLLSVAAFLTLFIFRAQDDNRLTSWQWVFADADVFRLVPWLAAGLVLAHALLGAPLPGRRPASLLFVCSFAVAGLWWSEPEVIVDASRYFTQAKHVELYGLGYFFREWGGQIAPWTDLPLIPALYGLIFSLLGEERMFIQVLTTLLFSGSVVLTYLIGKTLWDEVVGLHAGALLLGMPYLLSQVPLMLVDVPTMFLLALAVFATLKALERGGGTVMLAALAVALAFWTKYSAWLMLSVIPVVVLVQIKHAPRPVLVRAGALIASSSLLIGISLLPLLGVVSAQLQLLQGYQVPGLARWQESLLSTLLFQTHPFIAAAALLSVYAAVKRRDARYAIILWLPALLTLLEIKRIRYLLPALPMLALMAAYGLREIRDAETRKYVVLCIVASSLVIAGFGFRPFLQRASAINLKQAGEYLDSLDVSAVQVITLPQQNAPINPAVSVPLLDLYTAKRLVYRPDATAAPEGQGRDSPLRFTWEQNAPQYYAAGPGAPGALAVIADDEAQPLPAPIPALLADYSLAREFLVSENIFGYRTIVRVYLPVHKEHSGVPQWKM